MCARKRYNFYSPRIQIPVEDMFTSPGAWAWYCLPVDGAQALARIASYLKREITYVNEYVNDRLYYGPDETEYSAIVDLIGELEVALMSECGTDEIKTVLEQIDATLQAMVQCVCATSEWQRQQASGTSDLSGYVDVGNVTYENINDAQGNPLDPGTDTERCEYAQAMYWYTYTMFTETILPTANQAIDSVTAAIVGTVAFGAVATFIGIPVAILTGIAAAVVAWGVDGSIAEFTNWLFAAKDEITCIFYSTFPDYDAAAAEVAAFVDAAVEPSYLDKVVLKAVLASAWHMRFVVQDQQENGTWDTYIEAGACDDCDPTPPGCYSIGECNLDDWSEGTDVCMSGYAVHTGSISQWDPEVFSIDALGNRMRVGWVPRTDGSAGSPTCRLGVRRVSDGTWYANYLTPARPKDVLVVEDFEIATQVWGQDAVFAVKQEGWWAEIKYICIDPI